MEQVTQFYSALILCAVVAGILFFIILVLRELACWYLKINERLELEKEMLAQLKIISAGAYSPSNVETELLSKIHLTYKNKKYTACKNYCKEFLKRFPKSQHAPFATQRIAALP